jgi:cytochrome c551/c552
MQLVQPSLIRFFNVKLCRKNQSRNQHLILAEDASGVASNNGAVTVCHVQELPVRRRTMVGPSSVARGCAYEVALHFYFVPMTIAQ